MRFGSWLAFVKAGVVGEIKVTSQQGEITRNNWVAVLSRWGLFAAPRHFPNDGYNNTIRLSARGDLRTGVLVEIVDMPVVPVSPLSGRKRQRRPRRVQDRMVDRRAKLFFDTLLDVPKGEMTEDLPVVRLLDKARDKFKDHPLLALKEDDQRSFSDAVTKAKEMLRRYREAEARKV